MIYDYSFDCRSQRTIPRITTNITGQASRSAERNTAGASCLPFRHFSERNIKTQDVAF